VSSVALRDARDVKETKNARELQTGSINGYPDLVPLIEESM
jgi:hypothetical protein